GGDGPEVDDIEHRVAGALDPDQARVVADRVFERRCIGEIDEAEVEPRAAPAHAFEQPRRAAVDIVHGNDVAAGVNQLEDRTGGRHAGAEGKAEAAGFEIGDAALQRLPGRVLRARILVALVYAGALLHV